MKIQRASKSGEKMMVPKPADQPGLVVVDSTWGTLQPLEVAPGVRTIAELDVIEHLEAGLSLIDTRHDAQHGEATIPGAHGIPHEEIVQRIDELDADQLTVLFCNGPQCSATPHAVQVLLEHGYPADRLCYYRGGIHDWMTLGLPIEGTRATPTQSTDGGAG